MAKARYAGVIPDTLEYTSLDTIEDSVSVVRGFATTGKPRDMYFRRFELERLYSMVKEHEEKFYEALAKDMNKPRHEAMMADVSPVLDECLYFIKNIDRLTKDQKVKPRSIANITETLIIRRDPVGVVLIIGCWNYPLQLSLVPLAGAIAAGNSVILKLPESAPHTSGLITNLFSKYLDPGCYRVINGGVEETTALLRYQFDHIFYTGSSAVGKIVMTAAAKHLTPVTLELGGKSPAIITKDANMSVVANRIAFGKFFNTGQTCLAVDYVLVPKTHVNAFADEIKKVIKQWFGANPKSSKDFGRIINHRQFDRIVSVIENRKSGTVVIGGDHDRDHRYISPTVIKDVRFDDEVLMGEEIFGPVLPIISYTNLDDAVAIIKRGPPPLGMYVFSNNKKDQRKLIDYTPSGGVCINDTLMHCAEFALPFGGVGASGMGQYHGDHSFKTFTHERAILAKRQWFEFLLSSRYPPYTPKGYAFLRHILITHPVVAYCIIYKTDIKRFIIAALVALLVTLRYRLRA